MSEKPIVHIQEESDNGTAIIIKEKYGATYRFDDCNLLIEHSGSYHVTCSGKKVASFPVANHSWRKADGE